MVGTSGSPQSLAAGRSLGSTVQTIAVFTSKGGAGKSALTVFLAEFLATSFAKRVLVVDLDPQMSASIALLGEDRLLTALTENRSLAALLQRWLKHEGLPEKVGDYLVLRPEARARRGKIKYLQPLHVIPSDREAWHDLNEDLRDFNRDLGMDTSNLLLNVLQPLSGQFDVCLLDFHGQGDDPVIRCGLRAADWWLLPVQPDRVGTRDIEGSLRIIRRVVGHSERQLRMLGTVLNMCQNRAGGEYRRAKAALLKLAEAGNIPPLFRREAEIDFSVDAKNALDDVCIPNPPTLGEKFGGATRPFYQSVNQLVQDMLKRLEIPYEEAPTITFRERLNRLLTSLWSG